MKTIWYIGHSTRPFDEFIKILQSFHIKLLADIRSFPGSKRFPQYNKQNLEISLPQAGIRYIHLKNLGGRRKQKPGSVNTAWKHRAFRGYADYMTYTKPAKIRDGKLNYSDELLFNNS